MRSRIFSSDSVRENEETEPYADEASLKNGTLELAGELATEAVRGKGALVVKTNEADVGNSPPKTFRKGMAATNQILKFVLGVCIIIFLYFERYVVLYDGSSLGMEKEMRDLISINDVAIFTIALYGFNPTGLVLTLRSEGKWNGPIYVMSDRCTPRIEGVTMLDVDGSHLLTTGGKDHKNRETFLPHIGRKNSKMNSRLLKTRIYQFVHEKYVLFLDSDIEVNHPIHSYLTQISSWESSCDAYFGAELWYKKFQQMLVYPKIKHKRLQRYTRDADRPMFKFQYSPMTKVWQGGLFLVERDASSKILAAWGENILKGTYDKDQPALVDAIAEGGYNVCSLPDEVRYVPDFVSHLRGVTSKTFTHYLGSSTNRPAYGEKREPRRIENYNACDTDDVDI